VTPDSATGVVAIVAVFALGVPLLVCAVPLWLETRRASRARRRRGYIRISPNAYDNVNRATAPRAGTSTGCLTAGQRRAVRAMRRKQAEQSRTIVPTASGVVTESVRGDHTTAVSLRSSVARIFYPDAA
jgi:hypothetical protein